MTRSSTKLVQNPRQMVSEKKPQKGPADAKRNQIYPALSWFHGLNSCRASVGEQNKASSRSTARESPGMHGLWRWRPTCLRQVLRVQSQPSSPAQSLQSWRRDLVTNTKIVIYDRSLGKLVTREEKEDSEEESEGREGFIKTRETDESAAGLIFHCAHAASQYAEAAQVKVTRLWRSRSHPRSCDHLWKHRSKQVVSHIRSQIHFWSAALSHPEPSLVCGLQSISLSFLQMCSFWFRLLLFVPQLVLLLMLLELLLLLLVLASDGAGLLPNRCIRGLICKCFCERCGTDPISAAWQYCSQPSVGPNPGRGKDNRFQVCGCSRSRDRTCSSLILAYYQMSARAEGKPCPINVQAGRCKPCCSLRRAVTIFAVEADRTLPCALSAWMCEQGPWDSAAGNGWILNSPCKVGVQEDFGVSSAMRSGACAGV